MNGRREDLAERGLRYTREHFDDIVHDTETYVRENPLRKQLVTGPDDWPYQGRIHDIKWTAD